MHGKGIKKKKQQKKSQEKKLMPLFSPQTENYLCYKNTRAKSPQKELPPNQ